MSKIDFQNGFALGLVSGGVVEVADTTEIDALENLIDESGVLDSTESSVNKKVEKLIDKAKLEEVWYKASENITNANNLFTGYIGKTIPRTNLISTTSMGMFLGEYSPIEYINYYLDTKLCKNFSYCFRYATALKRIVGVNTEKATNVMGIFFGCSALETIEKPLDFSNVTDMRNPFLGCSGLKQVYFVEETIKKSITFQSTVLSKDSIQSIINGLAKGVTEQILTLSRTAVNKAFETEEGANNGSTEETSEWFNLIATKPDWTITLS